MTDSGAISAASLVKQAAAEAAEEITQQVASEDSLEAVSEEGYNPMAAARAQARNNHFRTIDTRKPTEKAQAELAVKGVTEADQKKDEDLAHQFQQRNPEVPADRLRQLKQSLNEDSTEADIHNAAVNAFSDPTLADEALSYLEQTAQGALKDKISRARQLLNEEKHREIIGGRNINSVAQEYATALGNTPEAMRNLYRDITGTERDHNTLFSYLSAQYPFEKLKEVVAFLLKGMAYDVKSKGPSISSEELIMLMKETKNLQSLLWVYLFFKGRLKLMHNLYQDLEKEYPETMTFETLAKSFMGLVQDRYPSSVKVIKAVDQIGAKTDEEKSIVLSQYRDAVRGVSPRIYQTVQHKQNLLLVFIQALEELEPSDEEKE